MIYRSPLRISSGLVLGFCLGLTGCRRAPSEAPQGMLSRGILGALPRGRLGRRRPAAPGTVAVSYPVEQDVTDYADFTARIAAVDSVEVRAQLWVFLEKVHFKEGSLVEKGDILFELDPRPYQAEAEPGPGQRRPRIKAQLKSTRRSTSADRSLVARQAVGESDLD